MNTAMCTAAGRDETLVDLSAAMCNAAGETAQSLQGQQAQPVYSISSGHVLLQREML